MYKPRLDSLVRLSEECDRDTPHTQRYLLHEDSTSQEEIIYHAVGLTTMYVSWDGCEDNSLQWKRLLGMEIRSGISRYLIQMDTILLFLIGNHLPR